MKRDAHPPGPLPSFFCWEGRHFLRAEGNKLVEGIQDMGVEVLCEEQRAERLAVPLHLCVVLCGDKGRNELINRACLD